MIPRWQAPVRIALLVAAVLALPSASFAQVKVIVSGGFAAAYREVLPEFERTTGIKVTTTSGASFGNAPNTIGAQLRRGVAADVVIMSREGMSELMAANRIAPGTDADLARTPIGVAVRAGAAKPDVRTVEAFKQVVLKAKLVAVPSSTSGIFLRDEVFPRLGIADKVRFKLTPRGTDATAMVASGEADIGLLPVSEIVHARGVELAGVIADEIQLNQVFAAAVVAGSKEIEAAKRLIAFLASERASGTIRSSGMEPLGKGHN